jgi:hypothetical protein
MLQDPVSDPQYRGWEVSERILYAQLAHCESRLVYTSSLGTCSENVGHIGDVIRRCYSLGFLEETNHLSAANLAIGGTARIDPKLTRAQNPSNRTHFAVPRLLMCMGRSRGK